MNVSKPRGLCSVLLLVTGPRIPHREPHSSVSLWAGTVGAALGLQGRGGDQGVEKLALGGKGTPMCLALCLGDSIGITKVKTPFLEGKLETQRREVTCPSVKHLIYGRLKPKSVPEKHYLNKYNVI